MVRAVFTIDSLALRLVAGLALVASVGGCGKSTIREYESHACSTNDSDDPFMLCSPSIDLICINTYTVPVTDPNEAKKWPNAQRPVYVCRLACNVATDCFQPGDICCPGRIHGKDYGKMGGCTPRGMCEGLQNADGGAPDDGGTPDAAVTPDGPPDAGSDRGPDGVVDAPAPDGGDGGPDAGGIDVGASGDAPGEGGG
jgi:hypothetical protein